MIDKTTVRRDLESYSDNPRVDVDITVTGTSENAHDVADRLAEAVYEELKAINEDDDE